MVHVKLFMHMWNVFITITITKTSTLDGGNQAVRRSVGLMVESSPKCIQGSAKRA
jgi:hypothetical protein